MGTLFSQDPRRSGKEQQALGDEITELKAIAKQAGVSLEQVLALIAVRERRRANYLAWDNGDIHDEQMGGIGELLRQIADAMDDIAFAVKK